MKNTTTQEVRQMSAFHAITRRRILQTGIAATLAGTPSAWADPAEPNDLLARDAYVWGFPLVMFGRYLDTYRLQGDGGAWFD